MSTASGHTAENDAPCCEGGGHTFPPPVTSGTPCVCGLLVVDTRVTTAAVCALSHDGQPCGVCDIPPGSPASPALDDEP